MFHSFFNLSHIILPETKSIKCNGYCSHSFKMKYQSRLLFINVFISTLQTKILQGNKESEFSHNEGVCADVESPPLEVAEMFSSCNLSDRVVPSSICRSVRGSKNSVPATLFPVKGSVTRPTLYTISASSCFTCLDLGSRRALRRTISPTVHCCKASWAK